MQHAYSRDDELEIVGPRTAEEYFAEALRALDKPRDARDARKAELIDGVLILFPSPLNRGLRRDLARYRALLAR